MSTRTPSEARPPRMEALARLPVFYALPASARSSRAAARPPPGRPSCSPPPARRSTSTRADPGEEMIEIAAQAGRHDPSSRDRGRRSRRRRDGDRRVRGRRGGRRLRRRGARAGVPVNVIDKPAFCDFAFGSIVNRSPLVIGISTDGAAPVFGQAIRAKLEALIPRGFARWAEAARQWRPRVQALALSFRERRRFWERFTERAVAEPDRAPAASDIDALMAADARRRTRDAGSVMLVGAGPGDPELLTLARRARAAVRRRHPDRRSRVAGGARFRAPRGEEDDGRQDRPRPGVPARARSTT